MKILVLGGTIFLGRHIVEVALKKGHEVTLFNRGQRNADLFPEVEKLRGNRDNDLTALQNRKWDVAIDTNGYLPFHVESVVNQLSEAVQHYTFISSLSAYADAKIDGIDENYQVGSLPEEIYQNARTMAAVTGETYGPLKARCEQIAQARMPGRVFVARPGLIVGPFDPTERFTYWPYRVAKGGEVLAPGRPKRPVQFIDVRDLAEWVVKMAESQQTGVYNANGLDYSLTMGELLTACQSESGSDARFSWLPEEFLEEHKVGAWMELPLWIPETAEAQKGFFTFDSRKAIAAGLTFRPVADTVRAILEWDATRPADTPRFEKAGMKPEREAELLAEWHKSHEQ